MWNLEVQGPHGGWWQKRKKHLVKNCIFDFNFFFSVCFFILFFSLMLFLQVKFHLNCLSIYLSNIKKVHLFYHLNRMDTHLCLVTIEYRYFYFVLTLLLFCYYYFFIFFCTFLFFVRVRTCMYGMLGRETFCKMLMEVERITLYLTN